MMPTDYLAPNLPGYLAPLQDRTIFLPNEELLPPATAALAWHRHMCMGKPSKAGTRLARSVLHGEAPTLRPHVGLAVRSLSSISQA